MRLRTGDSSCPRPPSLLRPFFRFIIIYHFEFPLNLNLRKREEVEQEVKTILYQDKNRESQFGAEEKCKNWKIYDSDSGKGKEERERDMFTCWNIF